jgi:hypothetical protein
VKQKGDTAIKHASHILVKGDVPIERASRILIKGDMHCGGALKDRRRRPDGG